jgi:Rrf2 family protein
MQITREADYAIRIMLEVAGVPAVRHVTSAEVARRRLVPRPFVRKIVSRLVSAGLLQSARGADGGLSLGCPANRITLLAILDAVQLPIAINECVLRPDVCALRRTCPVHEVCQVARAQLVGLFGSVRLSDLVQRGRELQLRAVGFAS